jgi:hypothetical protein
VPQSVKYLTLTLNIKQDIQATQNLIWEQGT